MPFGHERPSGKNGYCFCATTWWYHTCNREVFLTSVLIIAKIFYVICDGSCIILNKICSGYLFSYILHIGPQIVLRVTKAPFLRGTVRKSLILHKRIYYYWIRIHIWRLWCGHICQIWTRYLIYNYCLDNSGRLGNTEHRANQPRMLRPWQLDHVYPL